MNSRHIKWIATVLALVVGLLTVAGCGNKQAAPQSYKQNPVVTIEMDSGDIIEIELYPQIAPNTVNSFVSLVDKGFYDGLAFHRVIPGFMIQGGDPTASGNGGPGYHIKGEFTSNGHQNDLKHTAGVISMARAKPMDSAGSQFFLMTGDSPHLDGEYAAFGKVINGQDVVDKIASVDKGAADRPIVLPVMSKVTVDTHGEAIFAPITIQ